MKYKLAVIGSPIKHSLSPFIHKTSLKKLGIECEYELKEVEKSDLGEFILYAKSKGICGFNVTMPLKQVIMNYLDDIDEEAKFFGAVNTVKIKNEKLTGFNTDGEGYKKSLEEKGFFFGEKNVVLIGAGGAAATVAIKAAASGAKKITVLNRNVLRAKEIAERIDKLFKTKTAFGGISNSELFEKAKEADLMINATPLGMSGIDADFEDLNFLSGLKQGAYVSDFIYNPYETNFLKFAKSRGFETLNGLGMLIYQGLISESIYLEKEIDYKALKNHIEAEFLKR